MAGGSFGGGDGTEANPYIVEDYADFIMIRTANHYKQGNDMSFASKPSTPVLSMVDGSYDGNGYKITGVKIDPGSINGATGLFSHIKNCILQNIHLVGAVGNGGVSPTNPGNFGLLTGIADLSHITACTVSGSLNAVYGSGGGVGGLCGVASGTRISYCASHVSVVGGIGVGGFIGKAASNSTILDCVSTGAVSGDEWVGGFIGDGYAPPTNGVLRCYSSGSVTANAKSGGFVGRIGGTIGSIYKNCYCLAPHVRRNVGKTNTAFGAFSSEGVPDSSNRVLDTLQFIGGS